MVTSIYKKLMMLMLALSVSVASFASVEIDGICYELNEWSKNAGVTAKADKYSGSITIPSKIIYNNESYNVTYIGQYAFLDCSDLTSVTIPNSVESIELAAFESCNGITSITIPNSVRFIEKEAFMGCKGLTSVTLGNSITKIGECAFFGCPLLASINIPESVTTIEEQAFYACWHLTSINIPRSVTNIGREVFYTCTGLTSISVEKGNPVYDSRNNCNAIIETNSNKLIAGCKNTVIPNSVTEIGQGAFYNCIEMKSIVIPNSVTTIGLSAFSGCINLESIVIPNSVTTINSNAFAGCTNLKSVTIGKNVTSIGTEAFGWQGNKGCSALTSVTILAKTPPAKEIDYVKAFTTYGTLHVLPGCKAAYEAVDGWNKFTIVEDAVDPAMNTPEATANLIDAIGKVEYTESCKAKIDAARAAYDALAKEQQTLVKNLSVLLAAEEAYDKLAKEATGISNVTADNVLKDGKYFVNGKIVIVKNGRKYNLNAVSE